jgi:hypothetical protein
VLLDAARREGAKREPLLSELDRLIGR